MGRNESGSLPPLRIAQLVVVVLTVIAVVVIGLVQHEHGSSAGHDGSVGHTVAMSDLPPEAQHTLVLIRSGGPYPYAQDDTIFHNAEGLLPSEPTGYYREYTVVTPGSPDRGARRIIAGQHHELYYTDDHYRSFRQIEGAP
ncbi:guanyl-specific ribonuclease [Nocardioides terrisoli]|uniref:ribonuclease domain-containing protein n=1 Tax=Nocardioides terrisoli TaxID=3388267 RepID=UPI00287B7F54|nr:ribonuclease domain-containing protein [Nocardioides marmorisolisilvae]